MTALIFLLGSRFLGKTIEKQSLITITYTALTVNMLWGIAQIAYVFSPILLEALPIKVGTNCANSADFCLTVIRATGLTPNPFYFSWLCLVAFLTVTLLKPNRASLAILIIGFFSLSRSFIIASSIFIIKKANKKSFIFILIILTLIATYSESIEYVNALLDARFSGDVSAESRTATNLLAIKQLTSGSILGIGWSNVFYTDSTFAMLILKSGVPGLILYIAAWTVFFKELYKKSGKNKMVIYFAICFFLLSALVGSVEAQPGLLLLFTLYWNLPAKEPHSKILYELASPYAEHLQKP